MTQHSMPWLPKLRRVCGLLVLTIAIVLGAFSSTQAQIVASGSHCGTSAVDLCVDTSDDTLWVLDQLSGEVCQFQVTTFPPTIGLLAQVPHIFGAATFPNFTPRVTGIAYDPNADALFLLNRTDMTIQQMTKAGVATGAQLNLSMATPDPALFGLSYDSGTSTLWTLDVNSALLIQYDLLGNVVSTQGQATFGQGQRKARAGSQRPQSLPPDTCPDRYHPHGGHHARCPRAFDVGTA